LKDLLEISGLQWIYGFREEIQLKNVYNVLKERGFIEQVSDEDGVVELLSSPSTCYIGFDPTASSLHVGSLVPIMALAHLQNHGHRVIAVVGGGTGMIGDPSGKTEMRRIMTEDEINSNAEVLKRQLANFIEFSHNKALMLNNADWLKDLNYIEFLRDVGRHFSVNKMLAAESYRQRLKTGLNFIEFNYMLLQSYDFLHLYMEFDCTLQLGGNDQWGNILAGVDLIRRVKDGHAEAVTFPLLATTSGDKMGKTEGGAIWLDPEMTSPYDYYQYWINVDDRDVQRFTSLFTFLPMDEVRSISDLEGAELRKAKERLAYEATRICHGEQEADKAREASAALFRGESGDDGAAPSHNVAMEELRRGIPAFILFADSGLVKSRSGARRLISQGGAYLNGKRVKKFDRIISEDDLVDGTIQLRAGKKRFVRVVTDG
jgi:tyrosyl-tRNA synthetase